MAINLCDFIYEFLENIICGSYIEQLKLTLVTPFGFQRLLARFHITSTSQATTSWITNEKANITPRNLNKNMEMYRKETVATAWYEENDFARMNFSPFDQDHRPCLNANPKPDARNFKSVVNRCMSCKMRETINTCNYSNQ